MIYKTCNIRFQNVSTKKKREPRSERFIFFTNVSFTRK